MTWTRPVARGNGITTRMLLMTMITMDIVTPVEKDVAGQDLVLETVDLVSIRVGGAGLALDPGTDPVATPSLVTGDHDPGIGEEAVVERDAVEVVREGGVAVVTAQGGGIGLGDLHTGTLIGHVTEIEGMIVQV